MFNFLILLIFLAFPLTDPRAQECGDADNPCMIGERSYHILLPDAPREVGTIVHLHGGGGTGKGMLKSGLAKEALKRGYVVIAPNGEHPGYRYPKNWSVRANGSQFERDDAAFIQEVIDDAADRFDVDSESLLLAGFSRGASMVWDIACHEPDMAFAFAPVAGAFWDDLPDVCEKPVKLFHTHGWDDRTVPLEGRSLRNGSIVQGDVWASLFILRATNGCGNRQPESSTFDGDKWFRHWTDCEAGQIDLLLHPGGHGVPKGWSSLVLDWFEARLSE